MGWADYMSRNPVGKAHEISEYDQNFSVAVIRRLKPMLQKCSVRVIKAANQNRHANKTNIQATANASTKGERETKQGESKTKQQIVCEKVNRNKMQNQNTDILNDSNSTISSIPPDYEETIESISGFITAHESLSSREQPEKATDGNQQVD